MTRIQISSNVSQATREQANWLIENRGFSLRDVITIAIERLWQQEQVAANPPTCEVCGEPLGMTYRRQK